MAYGRLELFRTIMPGSFAYHNQNSWWIGRHQGQRFGLLSGRSEAMRVSEQIVAEAKSRPERMDGVTHGKVTFVIQDGKLVRVDVQDGWVTTRKEKSNNSQITHG
jgi:hypothetical protein